jgi:ABC-type phosphate transport system auxiliary subunit
MTTEAIPALLEQIDDLLTEPTHADETRSLARFERVLTDGYAYALVLEAERSRIERRMTELTGELDSDGAQEKAQELAQLSRRLSNNDTVLTGLRATLMRLRARVAAVRASA